MNFYCSKEFTGSKAWDSQHIASFDNVSVKLHWTDQPYKWHINDGQEVLLSWMDALKCNIKSRAKLKAGYSTLVIFLCQ